MSLDIVGALNASIGGILVKTGEWDENNMQNIEIKVHSFL